jgi:uncharacterized protein YkwD
MRIKTQVRIVFCIGLFVLFGTSSAQAAGLSQRESGVLQAMNRTRAAHGLPALRVDPALTRAARSQSAAIIRTDVFTHGSFASRITRSGARGPFFGENLAWGVGSRATADGIVRGWLASPGHRANLLRPGFRRVGLGALVGTLAGYRGATVVTADFAGA